MANITIKELLAADTVSEIVDKINFNFDQLLLNGGGPVGPIGNIGEIGPIGPRGTIWFTVADLYTTPTSPMWTGTPEMVNDINQPNYPQYKGDPNKFLPIGLGNAIESTLVFGTINKQLRDGDLYIQESDDTLNGFDSFDGDIWEFDGISQSWLYTGVNIKGDTGQSGTSGLSQWSRFIDGVSEVVYPTQTSGQDIPKILVGVSTDIQESYNPSAAMTIITEAASNLALGNNDIHGDLAEISNTAKITMTSNGELFIEGSNSTNGSDNKEIILRSYSNTRIISGEASLSNPTEYIQNSILNEHLFQSGRIKVKSNNINNTVHQLLNNEFADVGIDFILKPTNTIQQHRIITDVNHDLILQSNNRRVGIGNWSNVSLVGSKLSVDGNVSIGSGYKSITTTPINGLIVQGNTAIGNQLNTTSRLLINADPGTTQIAQEIINPRNASNAHGLKIDIIRTLSDVYALDVQSGGTSALYVSGNRHIGILTNNPTETITINGEATRTIKVANRLAAGQTGNDLIIEAGGVLSGNNLKGGNLILSTGSSTGITASLGTYIDFMTSGNNSGAQTTFRPPVTRVRIDKLGNTGFGTISPTKKVDINGGFETSLRIRGGNPQPGQTLIASDTNGNTAWTNDGVPTGAIIMWGGRIDAIPIGWQLCDGSTTSGNLGAQLAAQNFPFGSLIVGFPFSLQLARVPDLTARFVVGASAEPDASVVTLGQYRIADIGGANDVALTEAQMPVHKHSVNSIVIPSSGAHEHTLTLNRRSGLATSGVFGIVERSANQGNSVNLEGAKANASSNSNHSHTVPTHDTNNTGSGQSHENRPPYFALCYIIKHT
jgi:microcystin-dependent protein